MNKKIDYGPWVDLAGEILAAGASEFPAHRIADLLRYDLDAWGISFNWASHGNVGARVWPPLADTDLLTEYLTGGAMWKDPLVCWHDVHQCLTPQSSNRVPLGFGEPGSARHWSIIMRKYGIGDRLCIPLRLTNGAHVAFVAARADRNFSDSDLAVACRLQPMLSALYRQASVLQGLRPVTVAASQIGLTTREGAVLVLLAEGLKAGAIGRRLGISERTVHKHLEHLYRKLAATDRMTAVRHAHEAGLLTHANLAPIDEPISRWS